MKNITLVKNTLLIVALVLTIVPAAAERVYAQQTGPSAGATSLTNDDDQQKPVDNMHHFMEYVYGPVFSRLKVSLEKKPDAKDKAGWKAIKSDSLILAESTNLLKIRIPAKGEAKDWKAPSEALYKNAKSLYMAARKRDLETSQKEFKAISTSCAKCHESFR